MRLKVMQIKALFKYFFYLKNDPFERSIRCFAIVIYEYIYTHVCVWDFLSLAHDVFRFGHNFEIDF